jgi:TatA/E family protein of Tat protein translocase
MDVQPVIMAADFGISGMQWVIILVIALLLFGHKLPAMMRGLGGSVREFKKGINEGDPSASPAPPAAPAPPAPPAQSAAPAPTADAHPK